LPLSVLEFVFRYFVRFPERIRKKESSRNRQRVEKKDKIKLRKNVCLLFEKQRDIKETGIELLCPQNPTYGLCPLSKNRGYNLCVPIAQPKYDNNNKSLTYEVHCFSRWSARHLFTSASIVRWLESRYWTVRDSTVQQSCI